MTRSLASSCWSQNQPTSNNPSLLPIHITLPPGFTKAFMFVSNFVLFCKKRVCHAGIWLWFVSVVWHGKETVHLQENPHLIYVLKCCLICWGSAKVMALSPKAWVQISCGHMLFFSEASISLYKARKNSVCWLGVIWYRIDGFQCRTSHRWITNDI